MVPSIAESLFQQIAVHEEEGDEVTVELSFVQLYLETATDLLDTGCEHIKIVPDDSGNGYRTTAKMHVVEDEDNLVELILAGMKRRAQGATRANAQSSRSHAIVQLFLTRFTDDGFEIRSLINIVDLAGSGKL